MLTRKTSLPPEGSIGIAAGFAANTTLARINKKKSPRLSWLCVRCAQPRYYYYYSGANGACAQCRSTQQRTFFYYICCWCDWGRRELRSATTAHPQNKSPNKQTNKHLLFQFKTGPKNFSFILNLQCSLYLPKLVCVLVYLSFGGKKYPLMNPKTRLKLKTVDGTLISLDNRQFFGWRLWCDVAGTTRRKKKLAK